MEEKKVNADTMLNQIVAETMTRYNNLTENEYLKALGVDVEKFPNLKEDEVSNIAIFNMLLAMQRRLLRLKTTLNVICANLDMKQKNNAYKESKSKKRGRK